MSLPMILKLITPEGAHEQHECDDVILFACDDSHGKGGGSIGIHKGHAPAVIALKSGSYVVGKADGGEVFRAKVSGGFAKVEHNVVTVITPKAEE